MNTSDDRTSSARLLARMRQRAGSSVPESPMRRREAGEPAPLSFAQQRLWFLNQFAPDSAEYILPFPLRVTGPLDLPALERALTALVERHEVLRTRLVVDAEGDPEQLVDDPWTVSVPVVDLTGVAGAELRESMGRDAIEKEIGKPFDLAGGPLLRALLVRLGAGDSLLLL
ncbi:condensation domain-containing protein, partial [Actinoplanes couchii]